MQSIALAILNVAPLGWFVNAKTPHKKINPGMQSDNNHLAICSIVVFG